MLPGALLPSLPCCSGPSQNARPARHCRPGAEGAGLVLASAAGARCTLLRGASARSTRRSARCKLLAAASGVQETTRPGSSVSLVDFFRQASHNALLVCFCSPLTLAAFLRRRRRTLPATEGAPSSSSYPAPWWRVPRWTASLRMWRCATRWACVSCLSSAALSRHVRYAV